MPIDVVFETHSTTEDNERGYATGWLPGPLSAAGRRNAEELGSRRREGGIAAVFTSDSRSAGKARGFSSSGMEPPGGAWITTWTVFRWRRSLSGTSRGGRVGSTGWTEDDRMGSAILIFRMRPRVPTVSL